MNRYASYEGIWAINAGDDLVARETLSRDDYPFGPKVVFTEGRVYPVVSLHPMASPPFALVIDDEGHENRIQPDFLHHFRHLQKAGTDVGHGTGESGTAAPSALPGLWRERGGLTGLVWLDVPAQTPGMVVVAKHGEPWLSQPELRWQAWPDMLELEN